MEPAEETLKEEIRHDKTVHTEVVIGGLVLIILALGGVIWYLATHPPQAGIPKGEGATTTPENVSSNASGSLEESKAYYYVKAAYPRSADLRGEADAKAVALMKQFELDTIAQFKKDGNFDSLSQNDVETIGLGERRETLDITYVRKNGVHTVSFVYTITADTLGAHPNTYFRTFTFDTRNGANLELGELFTPGATYLQLLSTKSRQVLPAAIAAREGVKVSEVDTGYMTRGTTAEATNFSNWYLDGTSLVIIFPPYQVAPYAAGALTISLPLSQLPVRSEYQ